MSGNVLTQKNNRLISRAIRAKMAGVVFNLLLMMGFAGFLSPVTLWARELPPVTQTKVSFRQPGFTLTNRITSTSSFSVTAPLDLSSSQIFEITLDKLGYSEKTLTSPWGSAAYSFYLPADWQVQSGSFIDLDFSYVFAELSETSDDLERSFLGEILIYLDDQLLQSRLINASTLERAHLKVEMPPDLLNQSPGKRHNLRVELDASLLCNALRKASLTIHPASIIVLNYNPTLPNLDLANYPYPFYQRSFEPDIVNFVLPAEPTETELQQAATVAAGLGRLSHNRITINSTSDVEWLQALKAGHSVSGHLFVIGRPGRNQLINWLHNNLDLPAPLYLPETGVYTQETEFIRFTMPDNQLAPENDGILQEIASPWDDGKVILLITGATDEAVDKAGRALNFETHFPTMQGPVAFIKAIKPSPLLATTPATNSTLADLGYADKLIDGVYPQRIDYGFKIPSNWKVTDNTYLDLYFNHSQIIDEQASTMAIFFNDSPLADVPLNKENAMDGHIRVQLPGRRFRTSGSNKISLYIVMKMKQNGCQQLDVRQAWLSVSEESLLHLDYHPQEVDVLRMDTLPFPFSQQADLADVLFVLADNSALIEHENLLRIAAALGNAATGGVDFAPTVVVSNTLNEDSLNSYHIIAIGRPTTNSFIQQINNLLPQPFIPNTNEVEQQVGEVLLRLPPDVSLGYIQEIQSPWNKDRAVLIVTGTTNEGLAWATEAFSHKIYRLKGNLALIRSHDGELDILSVDTRPLTRGGLATVVATAMPELTPVATTTPIAEANAGDNRSTLQATPFPTSVSAAGVNTLPTWVKLLAGFTIVMVVGALTISIWRFKRNTSM